MTPETTASSGPVDRLLEHVEMARGVLSEERLALMQGAYDRIAAIGARKAEVLELLEKTIRGVPRSKEAVAALRRLITDSRRNEVMLAAVRDGLAKARRRIASIARSRRGVVAYQEDGSMIAVRSDRSDTDKSA